MKPFVHLHTHSHYSLLDGLSKIDELIDAAKQNGMKSLALTDHGVLYGAIEFYEKAKKAGIKPIIGVEAYILPYGESMSKREGNTRIHHIILLAETSKGYKNLIKLVTKAHLEGFYYKPRIDWETLKDNKEGIIALSGCLSGEVSDALNIKQFDKAKKLATAFENILGRNNFFLEIQPHKHRVELNRDLIKLSRETGIPLVATNDIHYIHQEDDQAHDVLLCLQTKRKKADKDRMTMLGENYSFRGGEEMLELLSEVPESLDNTVLIAERCNVEIPLGHVIVPKFKTPNGESGSEYLERLCREGVIVKYGNKATKEVEERLSHELSIITKMGFENYFLVVNDFVAWAKEKGIVVGPARGSAGSSIVSYLLNITTVDPLEYNLLFERFMNPDRVSPPDFDIDFTDLRRDEVIDYVEKKYGKDKVAQVITFGTMAARAAARDVGRVMGLSYNFCDELAKMIPMFTDLSTALARVPELKTIYDTNDEARLLIDTALKLEGVARHSSTHACAVLITPEPLTEYTPLQYASGTGEREVVVSQYSLHPVEDLGLLKIDFLGLKNLTIMETARDIILKIHGITLDLDHLPLNDKKTFVLFQEGSTTGVFQLESSGMKRYLKQLKPTNINDIIAMISLYRPGPMELIPDYIAGKHKKKKIHYLAPALKPILEETYGIAVYQEQVMQIARVLAGFSYAEADMLRKAVGKKIKKLLDEQKFKLMEGMVNNGIDPVTAEQIWQFIEPFARYGFNRAHATGYAMIAYQTAWLKSHYPVEFMASILTSDQGDTDRIAFLVDECKAMSIEVLPPDINESFSTFTVVAESLTESSPRIRFGLAAIKNIGNAVVKDIIHERKANGPYKTIENFLERVKSKDLNKKTLESLIKSGALDAFGERNELLSNIETLLSFSREVTKSTALGQSSLFESSSVMLPHYLKLRPAKPSEKKERLSWEKELLGLYVTEHPFTQFETKLSGNVLRIADLPEYKERGSVAIGGVVASAKRVVTRSGESMCFANIEDSRGHVEAIVFPGTFEKTRHLLVPGIMVIIVGKVSDKDGEIKIIADEIAELTDETLPTIKSELSKKHLSSAREKENQKSVAIEISTTFSQELSQKLRSFFFRYPGRFQVYLKLLDEKSATTKRIRTRYRIDFNEAIQKQIEEIVHPFRVHIEEKTV